LRSSELKVTEKVTIIDDVARRVIANENDNNNSDVEED
jgi:hypothetical protein